MARSGGRFKLIVLVVFVVGFATASGVLLRRNRFREDEKAIRNVLVLSRSTGRTPERVDADWPRLSKELARRLRRDPDGDLAELALRTTSRVKVYIPSYAYTGGPTDVKIQYGDRQISEEVFPERRFVWTAVVSVSVDRGPWHEIHRGWWTQDRTPREEVDLNRVVPADELAPGRRKVAVRLSLSAYLGENLPAAEGETPDLELLASRPASLHEVRSLGPFKLFIVDPPDRPRSG